MSSKQPSGQNISITCLGWVLKEVRSEAVLEKSLFSRKGQE